MNSPQITYFEVNPMADSTVLQAMKEKITAEMRAKIEGETGTTDIRFTFTNLSEPPPGPVVVNRWEARADFYCAKMHSPQIGYFELSTIDGLATLQAMKAKVAEKMRAKIEEATGKLNISFSFRNLSEPDFLPGRNSRWEVRADFEEIRSVGGECNGR